MESPPPPLSPRTKLWIVLGVLGGLGYAGWFQLIRDEPPRTPPGFVLPEPLPAVPDADNGLVYLDAEIEKQSWPEIEGGEGGHLAIIGWRKPWDAERMQPLVDRMDRMGWMTSPCSRPAMGVCSGTRASPPGCLEACGKPGIYPESVA